MLLNDRVCVITGAASARGIGKATARLFARHGARVAVLDLDVGQAEAAARDIGPGHVGLACDVTDRAACSAAADEIVGRLGRIDVLVNNAGITRDGLMMRMKPEAWNEVIDTNLSAVFFATQAATKVMGKARRGRIVNITSVVGVVGECFI